MQSVVAQISANLTITMAVDTPSFDKSTIADLVAKYGSSSATAWLEFDRYKIWRPSVPIPESEFVPVQGYMCAGESTSDLSSLTTHSTICRWLDVRLGEPTCFVASSASSSRSRIHQICP